MLFLIALDILGVLAALVAAAMLGSMGDISHTPAVVIVPQLILWTTVGGFGLLLTAVSSGFCSVLGGQKRLLRALEARASQTPQARHAAAGEVDSDRCPKCGGRLRFTNGAPDEKLGGGIRRHEYQCEQCRSSFAQSIDEAGKPFGPLKPIE